MPYNNAEKKKKQEVYSVEEASMSSTVLQKGITIVIKSNFAFRCLQHIKYFNAFQSTTGVLYTTCLAASHTQY